MEKPPTPLRPQDLVVLLAIAARRERTTQTELAHTAGVSVGEVSKSLSRSATAGLFDASQARPIWTALEEFLLHGAKYAFPAPRGPIVRGVPTSTAAPPLRDRFAPGGPSETPVWPSPTGSARGYAVHPLYPTVPDVAPRTPALYELLALTDAVREGRARERSVASELLSERLAPRVQVRDQRRPP